MVGAEHVLVIGRNDIQVVEQNRVMGGGTFVELILVQLIQLSFLKLGFHSSDFLFISERKMHDLMGKVESMHVHSGEYILQIGLVLNGTYDESPWDSVDWDPAFELAPFSLLESFDGLLPVDEPLLDIGYVLEDSSRCIESGLDYFSP